MNKVMPRSFSPRTFMGDHGINIDCNIKVEKIVAPKPWKPSHSRSTSTNSKFVEESLFEEAGNEIQTIILHSFNTYDGDSVETIESSTTTTTTTFQNNSSTNNSNIIKPNLVRPKINNGSTAAINNTATIVSPSPLSSSSSSSSSSNKQQPQQTCNILTTPPTITTPNNETNIKIASIADSLTSSLQGVQFDKTTTPTPLSSCTFNKKLSDEDSSSLLNIKLLNINNNNNNDKNNNNNNNNFNTTLLTNNSNDKLFYFEDYDSTVQDSLDVKNPFFYSTTAINRSSSPCMPMEPLTPPTRTHNPITLNQAFTENDIIHGAELGLLSISPPPQSFCINYKHHFNKSPSSTTTTTTTILF